MLGHDLSPEPFFCAYNASTFGACCGSKLRPFNHVSLIVKEKKLR